MYNDSHSLSNRITSWSKHHGQGIHPKGTRLYGSNAEVFHQWGNHASRKY